MEDDWEVVGADEGVEWEELARSRSQSHSRSGSPFPTAVVAVLEEQLREAHARAETAEVRALDAEGKAKVLQEQLQASRTQVSLLEVVVHQQRMENNNLLAAAMISSDSVPKLPTRSRACRDKRVSKALAQVAPQSLVLSKRKQWGIDLGTTTTLLSTYNTHRREANVVENLQGGLYTPSVVAYDKKDLLLDPSQRKEPKVGHLAESVSASNFVVVSDAKRIIGRRLYDNEVNKIRGLFAHALVANSDGVCVIQIPLDDGNGTFANIYPQVVSADVLKYVAKSFLSKYKDYSGIRAVVTIPAVFDETQRAATFEAAQIANVDIIQLVSEPTAAAVQYICGEDVMDDLPKNGLFLVVDLGGGTLDVSIVEVSGQGAELSVFVKGVAGDPLLGGRDFDAILAIWLEPILAQEHGIDMTVTLATKHTEIQKRNRGRKTFMIECRRVKEALTSNIEAEFNLPLFSLLNPDLEEEILVVHRDKFEKEIEKYNMLARVLAPINDALRKCNLQKEKLTAVLLAGGGCRMPIVEKWLHSFFGSIPIKKARNVDHVVSQGAAIMAHNINVKEIHTKATRASTTIATTTSSLASANVKPTRPLSTHAAVEPVGVSVVESLNHSLGLEVVGDKMEWMLRQGTPIPCNIQKTFTTTVNDQKLVRFTVRQGESEKASENKVLYSVTLDIEPRPVKKPQIIVEFKMDASQILRSKAYDVISPKKTLEIPVKLPGRIDEKSLSRLAVGHVTTDQQLTPDEQELHNLTMLFYRVLLEVQKIENPLARKKHTAAITNVEAFVLNSRGDSVSISDIQAHRLTLLTIEESLQQGFTQSLPNFTAHRPGPRQRVLSESIPTSPTPSSRPTSPISSISPTSPTASPRGGTLRHSTNSTLSSKYPTDRRGKHYRSVRDNNPNGISELPFKVGEEIVVTRKLDDDWWEGEVGGRSGVFPAAFVEEFKK